MKFLFIYFVSLFFLHSQVKTLHKWHSPASIVKKVIKNFDSIKTYKANFSIEIRKSKKLKKKTKGICYYKNPGKIRYDFSSPVKDQIVSNGKFLWIYLKNRRVVGIQDLKIDSHKKTNQLLYRSKSSLKRLFKKYHYKFNSVEQPTKISEKDPNEYFVLLLEQREKVGGYEKILLFINSETYFIQKAISYDGRGKEVNFSLYNIEFDIDIEEEKFNYRPPPNIRTIKNPLVTKE